GPAHGGSGGGASEDADHGGGLGFALVRPEQDARCPCRLVAEEARGSPLDRDGPSGRLPARLPQRWLMTRRLLLSYFLLTGFVLLVLEIPLGFSLTHNAEHNLLSGVGHDATVLATLVEDSVEQRQASEIAGSAGDYARRVGGRVVVVDSAGTTLFDSDHPSGPP